MKGSFDDVTIYPDGTFTLPPIRSVQATHEERAKDYRKRALVAMREWDLDKSGIYEAWAKWEESQIS